MDAYRGFSRGVRNVGKRARKGGKAISGAASRAKNKVAFENRAMFGYLSLTIYAFLAAGTAISILFLMLPSFTIPTIDIGLREGIVDPDPEVAKTAAFSVGSDGWAPSTWDTLTFIFVSADIACVALVAVFYVVFVRKAEKKAWVCDKDADTTKVKEGPAHKAFGWYIAIIALVFIPLVAHLMIFIKYMVILSIGKETITEDARAFVTWLATASGINWGIKICYMGYLLIAISTLKKVCTPATEIIRAGEPEEDQEVDAEAYYEDEMYGAAQALPPSKAGYIDPFAPITPMVRRR